MLLPAAGPPPLPLPLLPPAAAFSRYLGRGHQRVHQTDQRREACICRRGDQRPRHASTPGHAATPRVNSLLQDQGAVIHLGHHLCQVLRVAVQCAGHLGAPGRALAAALAAQADCPAVVAGVRKKRLEALLVVVVVAAAVGWWWGVVWCAEAREGVCLG
jgi:hypothetical protein